MYVEIDTELLLLAARGDDRDRKEIVRRIAEMSKAERFVLRRAIERLDNALTDVIIEERLERIRRNPRSED